MDFDEGKAAAKMEEVYNNPKYPNRDQTLQALKQYILAGRQAHAAVQAPAPAAGPDAESRQQSAAAFKKDYQPMNANPTEGMSTTEKVRAGAGKAFVDIGEGTKQLLVNALTPHGATAEYKKKINDAFGGAPTDKEVLARRKADQPLMNTKAGKAGEFLGSAGIGAALAPFTGGASLGLQAAAEAGGLQGALAPTVEGESRLGNALKGAAGGAIGHGVGKYLLAPVARQVGGALTDRAQQWYEPLARSAEAAKKAWDMGISLPPAATSLGRPLATLANKAATVAVGGKTSMEKQLSADNVEAVNRVARQEIGLRPHEPLTPENLTKASESARRTGYDPIDNLKTPIHADSAYVNAAKDLPKDIQQIMLNPAYIEKARGVQGVGKYMIPPKDLRGIVTSLREHMRDAYADVAKGGAKTTSEYRAIADQWKAAVTAAETELQRGIGNTRLWNNYVESRTRLAKIHDIKESLTDNFDVDLSKMAKRTGDESTGGIANLKDVYAHYPRALNVHAEPSYDNLDVLYKPLAKGILGSKTYQQGIPLPFTGGKRIASMGRPANPGSTAAAVTNTVGGQGPAGPAAQQIIQNLIRQGILPAPPQQ